MGLIRIVKQVERSGHIFKVNSARTKFKSFTSSKAAEKGLWKNRGGILKKAVAGSEIKQSRSQVPQEHLKVKLCLEQLHAMVRRVILYFGLKI